MGTVYATRGDGLGTRLLSIIYGRILAEMLDFEFKVIWPKLGAPYYSDYTVLDPAAIREVFSDNFVFFAEAQFRGDFVDGFPLDNSEILSLYLDHRAEALRDMDIENFKRSIADYNGVLYDHPTPLLKFMKDRADLRERVKHIWRSIAWSKSLVDSLENLVRVCAIREMIAVHVRRGDILETLINGDLEYLKRPSIIEALFQRYTAVKAYVKTIDSLRRMEDIFLCSDEADIKKYFLSTYGSRVYSSHELFEGTPNQRAFADLILLAQSKLLVAPSFSLFSECAASVGRCKYVRIAPDLSSLLEELSNKLDDEANAGRIPIERCRSAKAVIYAHASKKAGVGDAALRDYFRLRAISFDPEMAHEIPTIPAYAEHSAPRRWSRFLKPKWGSSSKRAR